MKKPIPTVGRDKRLLSTRAIADAHGVDRETARVWRAEPDFPARSGRRGWSAAEVAAWVAQRAATNPHAQAGPIPAGVGSLREAKLLKEIEYLDQRVRRSIEASETVAAARAVEDREARRRWAVAISGAICARVERWRMARAARASSAELRAAIDELARDLRQELADGHVADFDVGDSSSSTQH